MGRGRSPWPGEKGACDSRAHHPKKLPPRCVWPLKERDVRVRMLADELIETFTFVHNGLARSIVEDEIHFVVETPHQVFGSLDAIAALEELHTGAQFFGRRIAAQNEQVKSADDDRIGL